MNLTLLGTGSPQPNPERQGAAIAVQIGNDRLLFDAGRGAVLQLVRAGIPLRSINPVFITHHHFDHIGDLFDVVLSTWIDGRTGILNIFGPSGMAGIVNALLEQVYSRDIAFRAGESNARPGTHHDGNDIAKLEVREVGAGVVYETDQYRVLAEHVKHHYSAEEPGFDWVCLGYRIEADSKVLAISGDTVSCDGLDRLARGADVLIQCCYRSEADITDAGTEHSAKYVLATAGQAGRIAARAGAKRLLLTHFSVTSEDNLHRMASDAKHEFSGEVILGSDLMKIDV